MSKPLELTVYETDEETGRYMCGDGVTYAAESVDEFADWKRLTDAELAAEFWAAENEAKGLILDGYYPHPARREAEILLRFAITPHYCEDDV